MCLYQGRASDVYCLDSELLSDTTRHDSDANHKYIAVKK